MMYYTIENKLCNEIKMLSSNQHTLSNLRMMAGVKIHEYIQTDRDGNILSYLSHNFINCVSSAIYGENFDSTMRCIRKLYVDEMPVLLDKLMKSRSKKELKKIYKLLDASVVGLKNLKTVYQGTSELAHVNTVIDDFADTQLERLKEFLDQIDKEDGAIDITHSLPIPQLKRSVTIIDKEVQITSEMLKKAKIND